MHPMEAAVICKLAETTEGQKALAAMDEERQEACIHCGKVWYAIHHRDGICHECVAKKLPGQSVLRNRQVLRNKILAVILFIAWVASVVLVFSSR